MNAYSACTFIQHVRVASLFRCIKGCPTRIIEKPIARASTHSCLFERFGANKLTSCNRTESFPNLIFYAQTCRPPSQIPSFWIFPPFFHKIFRIFQTLNFGNFLNFPALYYGILKWIWKSRSWIFWAFECLMLWSYFTTEILSFCPNIWPWAVMNFTQDITYHLFQLPTFPQSHLQKN